MPLSTQIIRDDEPLKLHWGNFHVAAMALASCFDSGDGKVIKGPESVYEVDPKMFECYPDAPFPVTQSISFALADYGALSTTPLNNGAYTLKSKHAFRDNVDGEILVLLPGDVLHAWR